MSFKQLPPEMLLQIASVIDSESDLASLVQVNRAVYQTLISRLYLRNATNSGGSAILRAAESGNCLALEKALQAWTDAKSPAKLPAIFGRDNYTPLFLAAKGGNLAAAKMLLDYGADPNVTDYFHRTPLNVASRRGHLAVVETLLEHPKIKVNAYDKDHMTPMWVATKYGHAEIAKMLLSSGAHAGYVYIKGRQSPLYSAVLNNQPDLVRLLVNRKDVDPNALSSNRTPLQVAVDANEEDLVEILLTDKRVHPDLTFRNSQTPLLEAALKNNMAMVDLLLAAGANREIQDSTFLSPAMLLDAPNAEARQKLIQNRPLLGVNLVHWCPQ